MRERTYYGWTITRVFPSGYWSAWSTGRGYLLADTLAGLRSLIREHGR